MAYQRTTIHGNLGSDVEVRYTPSGGAVANFSVAVGEKWKDKDGKQQEHTEWFRCTAFGRTGEIISQYFSKGSAIIIDGKHRTNKYQDKNTNEDKYSTSLIVNTFDFVGSKGDNQTSANSQGGEQQAQSGGADFSDDVPFAPMSNLHW